MNYFLPKNTVLSVDAVARCTCGNFSAGAKALDVVAECWTLLVVRGLLLGPRRFTDLPSAPSGLGTSVLAARLNQLEARPG